MSQAFFGKYRYLLIILVFAIIARISWLKLTQNSDEGELGYDAMLWLRGESPYSARFSEKPPLAYLVYMASNSFSGNTVIPARIFNDALFFISIIALYLLVKKWYGTKVSLVTSFLYVFFMNAPSLWGPYAVTTFLSLPFAILSVLMCTEYVETGRTSFLVTSGNLLSIAGLIRLNSFVTLFVLLVVLIFGKRKRLESSERFLDSLTANISVLLTSISLPLLLVITYFWLAGNLGKMIYNVLIRTVMVNVPALSVYHPPSGELFLGLMEALPLLVLTVLGCIACVLVRKRSNIYVISWLLVQFPLFALGPHDLYHLAVILPAASILSGSVLCLSLEKFAYLKLNGHFLHMPKHRTQTVLISAALILLFLPSLYFQALQFPSGNTDLASFSAVGSYDETVELANYIRSLNVKDGEVLTQYWIPYVYWYAGIKAPSIYLNTYDRGSGIPYDEYEKILAQVKDKEFPYVIVNSAVPDGADPITDNVRDEYFPLKSIGGMDVFSATASYPAGVFFSFITRFREAQANGVLPNGMEERLDEMNNSVVIPRVESLAINNERQFVIRQHPLVIESNITYTNVQIPSNATLEFSIALDPAVWTKPGDGVLFEISIQHNGQSDKLLSKYINPARNQEDRKWHNYGMSLAEYDNRTVNVSFITNPGPANDTSWDWAYWGNPLIRQG